MGRRRPARAAALLAFALLATGVLAPSGSAAACPNQARLAEQGTAAASLPACMALEMVSPPKKNVQPAFLPSFSREGGRIVFTAEAALADTPGYQYFGGDRYVATRGPGGWTTHPTTPPASAQIVGGGANGGNASIFTPALDGWVQLGATLAQNQLGISTVFRGGLSPFGPLGTFGAISPLLVPINNSGTGLSVFLRLHGGSSDLSLAVLQIDNLASTSFLPEDPRAPGKDEPGGDFNSYLTFLDEAGEPQLELLARDKDDVVWGGRCGAHLGGEVAAFNQGAVSPDGSTIFFTTRPAQPWDEEEAEGPQCDTANPLRVLKRSDTPAGPVIAEIAPGAGPGQPGDDLFQAASADGSKAYLLSPRKLTASDSDADSGPCSAALGASKGCDLYLYDEAKPPAERLTQVSKGAVQANVLNGIPAVSGDGSRAYFVAQGALTADPNPAGDTAQQGQPNLYLYDAGAEALSFLAVLDPADQGRMWGAGGSFFADAYATPLHGKTEIEGGDGHVLAFASKAKVTSDDEDASRDVFRFDAEADTLERISKAAGGSDDGAFDVIVGPTQAKVTGQNFGESTRWISEDGQTIAFSTQEPLLPGDEDEAINPYIWHQGELGASFSSSPGFAGLTEPPAVSPQGTQVAFSTLDPLLPQDGDTAPDVYVARQNGGFPAPVEPTICDPLQEGSCRQASLGPQAPAAPATASFSGPGNVKQGPTRCRKPRVKRRGRCVKPKQRKGKARKKAAGKRRGGRR